jgi:hypothetical protein
MHLKTSTIQLAKYNSVYFMNPWVLDLSRYMRTFWQLRMNKNGFVEKQVIDWQEKFGRIKKR